MRQEWQTRCAERKAQQLASIPREWLITLPPDEQRNVQDTPKTCGLLTTRDLEITETTDIDVLLGKLATGTWSSYEVTFAFYKRAVIAQQLVSLRCVQSLESMPLPFLLSLMSRPTVSQSFSRNALNKLGFLMIMWQRLAEP